MPATASPLRHKGFTQMTQEKHNLFKDSAMDHGLWTIDQ